MAITFQFYTDAGLTVPYSGLSQFAHQSDLSDGDQDIVLYFGSQISGRELEAQSSPGVDNITITPVDILPEWLASTAYTVGETLEPTVGNGYRYVVQSISGGGTSGASEPNWPTAIGSTVVDNEITWVCIAPTHEPTEIKLATTSGDLDSAVAGAALSLGVTLSGGSGNAIAVHIRLTNAVQEVSSNTGNPELGLQLNPVVESAV